MKSAPVLLDSATDKGRSLVRIEAQSTAQRDEAWLQRLLFEHPEILPVAEFDETYCPLIPAGREVETHAGFIDNLNVSPTGGITIVETKLWKNPDKHRTVVAQIIDYAKELSKWTYDDLNSAVLKASRQSVDSHKRSLDEVIQPHLVSSGLGLEDFQERIIRTLSNGEFLLLIVGDRISPNLALLTEAISGAPGLDFRLGLVELQLYALAENSQWPVLAVPDIVGRTVEKTRGVIKVQYVQDRPKIDVSVEDSDGTMPPKEKTTQKVFLDNVPNDLAPVYERWLNIWRDTGIFIYWGVVGFTLRPRVNGKPRTFLDAYPEAIGLIRESDAKYLEISDSDYRRYVDAIASVPEARGILSAGKKYVKHLVLTADALEILLRAITELIPAQEANSKLKVSFFEDGYRLVFVGRDSGMDVVQVIDPSGQLFPPQFWDALVKHAPEYASPASTMIRLKTEVEAECLVTPGYLRAIESSDYASIALCRSHEALR